MAVKNTIQVAVRGETKGRLLKELREKDWVPAVVYSKDVNQLIQLPLNPLEKLISQASSKNFLVELDIEGGEKTLVLLQDLQRNPLTDQLLHVDFLAVKDSTQVKVKLTVNLVGEPEGVGMGGMLEQLLHTIQIKSQVKDLPKSIEVNIEHLKIDETLPIKEVKFPQGVVPMLDDKVVVALVTKTRVAQSSEESEGDDVPISEEQE